MPSILSDLFSTRESYTIGELMSIDPGRIERSMGCSVSLLRTFHEVKKASLLDKFRSWFQGKSLVNIYYVIFQFQVLSSSGKKYQVIIKCSPDFNLTEWTSNKVQIYCQCPDFQYHSAYILKQGNSLFLTDRTRSALGEAVSKSPRGKTRPSFLCKHAYAALSYLVNNYSSIMRTI